MKAPFLKIIAVVVSFLLKPDFDFECSSETFLFRFLVPLKWFGAGFQRALVLNITPSLEPTSKPDSKPTRTRICFSVERPYAPLDLFKAEVSLA